MKKLKSLLLIIPVLFVTSVFSREYVVYEVSANKIDVITDEGIYTFTPYSESIVEVLFNKSGAAQIFSFSIASYPKTIIQLDSEVRIDPNQALPIEIANEAKRLLIDFGELRVEINKSPFAIKYFRKNSFLFEEDDFYIHNTHTGFRMKVEAGEKFYGGGMRAAGMNRRNNIFALYNKDGANAAEQMYYPIPGLISNKHYLVYFDNVAKGNLDLAKTKSDIIEFTARGGRSSYIVIAGRSFKDLTKQLTNLVGKQPLPPLWAFGNFASRAGYSSQKQVLAIAKLYKQNKIPLDAIVLDSHWLGKDKSNIGNLDWDERRFATPRKMLSTLKNANINTVLMTQPAIATASKNWDAAVENNVFTKNLSNTGIRQFDFDAGPAGLVDIFNEEAAEWFWQKIKPKIKQGIAGIWNNLGEPDAQPDDSLHSYGTAEELHNAYGQMWARSFYLRSRRDFPEMRPFLLMRSGFIGSQRFGVIPRNGDVERSWAGLAQQLEIALQMSMFGLSYIHADLGGSAGGKKLDKKLYIRWLQFGAFTPIFRPYSQDDIALEPVYQSAGVKKAVAKYINLRYKLLPYNYTLAWRNSKYGDPMMQPLINVTNNDSHFEHKHSYMWGDSLLIHPIVTKGQTKAKIYLPKGIWYDFFRKQTYEGAKTINYALDKNLPVFVRAGSIIPMAKPMTSTANYNRTKLEVHIYSDATKPSIGEYYEDDGKDPKSLEKQRFILTAIAQKTSGNRLQISFNPSGKGYENMPLNKQIEIIYHGFEYKKISKVTIRGQELSFVKKFKKYSTASASYYYLDRKNKTLRIKFNWDYRPLAIAIQPD